MAAISSTPLRFHPDFSRNSVLSPSGTVCSRSCKGASAGKSFLVLSIPGADAKTLGQDQEHRAFETFPVGFLRTGPFSSFGGDRSRLLRYDDDLGVLARHVTVFLKDGLAQRVGPRVLRETQDFHHLLSRPTRQPPPGWARWALIAGAFAYLFTPAHGIPSQEG